MLHLNIIKVKTPEEMGKAAADEFEAVICRKPACVMGLATGSVSVADRRKKLFQFRRLAAG